MPENIVFLLIGGLISGVLAGRLGIGGGTLRFSIGLEPNGWLKEKFIEGLDKSA